MSFLFVSYAFKLGIILLFIKELQAADDADQVLFHRVHKGWFEKKFLLFLFLVPKAFGSGVGRGTCIIQTSNSFVCTRLIDSFIISSKICSLIQVRLNYTG